MTSLELEPKGGRRGYHHRVTRWRMAGASDSLRSAQRSLIVAGDSLTHKQRKELVVTLRSLERQVASIRSLLIGR